MKKIAKFLTGTVFDIILPGSGKEISQSIFAQVIVVFLLALFVIAIIGGIIIFNFR